MNTTNQPPTMLLKIFICEDNNNNNGIHSKYIDAVEKHNNSIISPFFNSGFDLFNPTAHMFTNTDDVFVKYNLGVRAAAFDSVSGEPMPFYAYPRSSIYKTPLRLANSVGIIDAGYRGDLCALFDKRVASPPYTIVPGDRLLQICAPDLRRIHVTLVNSVEDLGTTERGEGGFGSTGK